MQSKKNIELLYELEKRFKDKNTSVLCKELKGINSGTILRSCRGCVEDAAEILEELVKENWNKLIMK